MLVMVVQSMVGGILTLYTEGFASGMTCAVTMKQSNVNNDDFIVAPYSF